MCEGLNKATNTWIEKSKNNRKELICPVCGSSFMVSPQEANKRKYCSLQCTNSINIQKATQIAGQKKIENTKKRNQLFYEDIMYWSYEHKNTIMNCPYNKISTTLSDIQVIAINKYQFSDWRSICIALCGNPSKKELLQYLQNKIRENIC